MPKVVNYPARFEFLRRAAFVVVRDDGPQALSRRAVAAALGTSVNSVRRLLSEDADLRLLALHEVDRRRSRGRWGRPQGLTGSDLAMFLLRLFLPDEDARMSEELVWLRLALDAHQPTIPDEDSAAALRADHAIADRGYVPDDMDVTTASVPVDPLAERLAEHGAALTRAVADALAAIGIDLEAEQRRTRAVVNGLVLDTCLGRTTPEQAVSTLEHHIASLGHACPAPASG